MFGEQGGGVSFSYLINATTIPALESLAGGTQHHS